MIELRQLQMCQLDIALNIKTICEKNDIPYFLIGGTLLGAVRHKGFIPWDDDMDIGLLRKDYDRFIEICKSDLPDHLYLQTWDTDFGYAMPFAKIMLKGTKYREEASGKSKANSMIFVDVFPYDNKPDNIFEGKILFFVQEIAKKMLQYKMGYDMSKTSSHKTVHKFLKIISKLFSIKLLKQLIYKFQIKCNKNKTKLLINYNGAYRDKEVMNYNGSKLDKMIFEGYEFSVPFEWDELLKNMYGNYMELPPVEKRGNRHKAIEADIGNYKISNKAYCERI